MDGIHDLGGRAGFGPVDTSGDQGKIFAADWERRSLGMTFASFLRGLSTGGQFRHSIERMEPVHYAGSRYYEHWFTALATRLIEENVVGLDELERRAGGAVPLARPAHPDAVAEAEAVAVVAPGPTPAVGERVRVTSRPRLGHTRCPWFVRGRVGTVVRVDREASLDDLEAHTDKRRREPVCCVQFDSAELWGPTAEHASVHVDLMVSYLAAAEEGAHL
ncbi:MAG: SH3-like domain-containing protein [Acidimicrobiales bacterium]